MPNLMKKKPQRLLSEQEVLKRLNIPDFRHLSKDTAIEFISSIPEMDPEVAKKALEQFPDFARLALEIANETKQTITASFDANDKSSQATIAGINAIIEALTAELQRETLSSEEKMQIVSSLTELGKLERDIHKDNQNFILKGLGIFAGIVAVGIGAAAAILGANSSVGGLPDFDDLGDSESNNLEA